MSPAPGNGAAQLRILPPEAARLPAGRSDGRDA